VIHSRRAITYGGEVVEYEVLFATRKTLEIAVHPDLRVVIKAPRGTSEIAIQSRARKRARWIKKQRDYFRQFDPRTPPRQYVGGETHRYLGRQYRLKLIESDKPSVKLTGRFFWVSCPDRNDSYQVKTLLEAWYSQKAHEKFVEYFERCWPEFERLNQARPKIQIRRMKSRWGSLSKSDTLTLNVALVQAPRECIDYVITHELCHLLHHDHGPSFYRLLEKVMPDWEKRKHKLELALI
jgi:predicted metal-dependent hydrolase